MSVAAFGNTVVVDGTSNIQWLANASDPGLGESWTASAFDDSSWTTGTYGIGYDNAGMASGLIATTVPNTTVSVYSRTSFNLSGTGSVGNLYLGVDYDDGWALWINGTEVARSPNMPGGALDWDSAAGVHESSNAAAPTYEWFDVSAAALPALRNGNNIRTCSAERTTPWSYTGVRISRPTPRFCAARHRVPSAFACKMQRS
jgi:hypothetical protein